MCVKHVVNAMSIIGSSYMYFVYCCAFLQFLVLAFAFANKIHLLRSFWVWYQLTSFYNITLNSQSIHSVTSLKVRLFFIRQYMPFHYTPLKIPFKTKNILIPTASNLYSCRYFRLEDVCFCNQMHNEMK